MTTAEKYRQLEKSPAINIAKYIFSCVKDSATNTLLGNEIIEIKTGKTPSKQNKKFYEDDYLNWFKPDEIGSDRYLYEAKDKLSKYAYENNQATIYEPDTILINAIGDVGRISILKVKASSNQQITGIRLNEKIDVDYAYFYLLANRDFFYVDLFQTTLPIVNQKKINSIPFAYPDINEQKNIVEGLVEIDRIKSVDDLKIIDTLNWNEDYKSACRNFFSIQFSSKDISNELTHQLTLLKKLRQQLLQDAVQGKLISNEALVINNEETGQQLLAKIKAEKEQLIAEKKLKKEKALPPISADEIPFDIPENWVWCRLGEIILSAKDGPHFSPKYSESGIPFISTRNVSAEGIDFTSAKYISEEYHEEISRKCKPEKGDLLYTKGGTTGIATVNTYDIDFNVWVHVAVLRMSKTMNPFYLKNCLNSPHCYKQSQELTRGISNQDLGLTRMVNISIPLPPLSQQNLIVQKLDELMQYCNELEASIKASQTQNEQLLQQVLREALRK